MCLCVCCVVVSGQRPRSKMPILAFGDFGGLQILVSLYTPKIKLGFFVC
jgi:hypothetical protein